MFTSPSQRSSKNESMELCLYPLDFISLRRSESIWSKTQIKDLHPLVLEDDTKESSREFSSFLTNLRVNFLRENLYSYGPLAVSSCSWTIKCPHVPKTTWSEHSVAALVMTPSTSIRSSAGLKYIPPGYNFRWAKWHCDWLLRHKILKCSKARYELWCLRLPFADKYSRSDKADHGKRSLQLPVMDTIRSA